MTNLDILLDAKGIGPSALEKFEDAGYESIEEVGRESPNNLSNKVSGVGYTTAISVLKYLEKEGYREEKKNDDELEKLVELLQELFEFDTKDRDFGVYKLMNANREKIDKFIQDDLVKTIETEIEQIQNEFSGTSESKARDEVLEELGTEEFFDENNNTSKKARELIESKNDGVSENELENIRADIYNHIYTFFSNYYNNGDFINRRQRSHHEEPYAVPYDGSNTNFYWVTKNQYYSKTSEQFMRFTFNHQNNSYKFNTINSEYDGSGIGNDKYFVMNNIKNINISNDEIKVNFYRRMIGKDDLERFEDISKGTRNKQDKMNETFTEELTDKLREENIAFDKEKLQNKIDEYTTRNQNDFFIHKDLEKFLQSELEEYIKTEIVKFKPSNGMNNVTDISMEKARIVNEISMDIISFISQIEEFKRKLFEKKKFVKDSKKIIQVSEVPENYYKILLENKPQLESWEKSYNINTKDLTEDKLKASPYNQMVVDTKYFDIDITKEEPKNKLIKGDNYQALNFLKEKYKNSVKCIYIDPPYNTGKADFAYKDKYKRPTWLSMMYDRIKLSYNLLDEEGIIFISIDEHEMYNLRQICNNIFGEENLLQELIWNNGKGNNTSGFSDQHEYVLCYAKNKSKLSQFKGEKRDLTIRMTKSQNIQPFNLTFPKGIEFKGEKDTFSGFIGKNSQEPIEIISDKMVFENGKLKEDVTLKAEWTMHNRFKNWLKDPDNIYDEKKQKIKNFFFNKNGKPKCKKIKDTVNPPTILKVEDGTKEGEKNLDKIINNGSEIFDYPKPPSLIKYITKLVLDENDVVLDFFAGSGTTGQAVQELNRENNTKINYILVEMLDEAFDITEERAKRVAFTSEWKDGKPQLDKIEDENELEFSAECIELESYEEALDAVKFDDKQSSLGDFKDTLLNYMLEFGTKNSSVFLDTDQLSKPKEYTLDGELKEKSVDVMTTFNYLIGLGSVTRKNIEIDDVDYTIYEGIKDNDNICVIWRHNADEANYKLEKEELDVDNYERVYINGDSILDNSIPISSEFKKQMLNN